MVCRVPSSTRSSTENRYFGAQQQLLDYSGVLLGALVLLQIFVRLAAPDEAVKVFPSACPAGLPQGCSRIAVANAHRDGGHKPFRTFTSILTLRQTVVRWAKKRGGVLLEEEDNTGMITLQFRFLSSLMGFPDDLFVFISCSKVRKSLLQVSGQGHCQLSSFSTLDWEMLGLGHTSEACNAVYCPGTVLLIKLGEDEFLHSCPLGRGGVPAPRPGRSTAPLRLPALSLGPPLGQSSAAALHLAPSSPGRAPSRPSA
mmetsp:Transcript_28335/g.67393  ORF Transcript_28335/g.67393 Transcript_28335/m.67393 type:complete len:256 (-) Transcript_28335:706-1473(-)